MTSLVPRRMKLRSLFDQIPVEQWFNNMFEENRLTKDLDEWGIPRADVRENDKDFLISVELPGLDEKEVEVKITGNQLIVTGERKFEKEADDEHYHRVERHYGSFERTFDLPPNVKMDAESVTAKFKKGVLEIRLPKVEPHPVAKIPVKFD